jgi:hypothetical protein
MKSRNYVFIGGKADGKIITLPENRTEILLPVFEPMSVAADAFSVSLPQVQTERYYREELRSQWKSHFMFRHESLNTDDIMEMLLKKYAESKEFD